MFILGNWEPWMFDSDQAVSSNIAGKFPSKIREL